MKKINKKAKSFYTLFLALIFVFLLLFTVLKLIEKYSEISNAKKVGERQSELARIYQKGEKVLQYSDTSAQMAAEQALYDFAQNGGMKDKQCGTYKGYAIWDETCVGKTNDYLFYTNENLNVYLNQYPDKEITIPKDNFMYSIKEENGQTYIIARADRPIQIEVNR